MLYTVLEVAPINVNLVSYARTPGDLDVVQYLNRLNLISG